MVCTPTNTYPQPSHVSLGTTSPLLLQSSGLFPVDLVSSPSTLDISLYPLCSYLKVPTMSFTAKLLHLDMMSEIFFLDHLLRCLLPSCGICFSFLQRILAHQNFASVRNLPRGRHLTTPSARHCLCRRSRHGRRRPCAFNLSLLRQRQHFQETRISPFSQPLQHHSHPQSTLSHTTPSFSGSPSATLSTPAHTSPTGKRAGPANSHVGNNKKQHKPPPPTPLVQALQGLTLNIRGMTPAKWVAIQELPAFSSLNYIILTEHQLSAEFRPDEIIKSGWDFHAVSATVTTLPQRGYRGQRYRGGLALLTCNSMRFSIAMHSLSGAVNTILGDNCTSLNSQGSVHGSGTSPSLHQAVT